MRPTAWPTCCEFADIQKINLATGTRTVVVNAANTRGVLVTDDGRFLLVSSDAGTITQYDLVTHTSRVLASGLGGLAI